MAVDKNKILLTEEGYQKLMDELKHREGNLRSELQETLNQMRSQGDLKENDGYTIAVEDFQNNEEKILDIKKQLENSEIVKNKSKNSVTVGSKVTIECEGGNLRNYTIVGEDETNPMEGKISYKSPIGESLMDQKKGMDIKIKTPRGETVCKIVSID